MSLERTSDKSYSSTHFDGSIAGYFKAELKNGSQVSIKLQVKQHMLSKGCYFLFFHNMSFSLTLIQGLIFILSFWYCNHVNLS